MRKFGMTNFKVSLPKGASYCNWVT
jgi:hypothetical protein